MQQPLACRSSLPKALAITALMALTWSCGTKTTGIDERCADLAATGYTELKQMQELLQLTKQPSVGSAAGIRQRTMALCVKEAG
jgi:hypothetical protein